MTSDILKTASLATIISIIILAFMLHQSNSGYEDEPSEYNKKALIIDGLELEFPNEDFIKKASRMLEEMEYSVDVQNDVTVSLYESLPSMGYDIIIFRTHSVAYPKIEYGKESNFLDGIHSISLKQLQAIFTTEPYNQQEYVLEQLTGQLARVTANESNEEYFAITSAFMQDKMVGDFRGAKIIMMGCSIFIPDENVPSTQYESIPQILIDKGVSIVVGWSGLVSIDHTDSATLYLLDRMNDGMNLEDAINSAKERFGEDPEYGGALHYLSNLNRK